MRRHLTVIGCLLVLLACPRAGRAQEGRQAPPIPIDTGRIAAGVVPLQQQLSELQALTHLPRHKNNLPYLKGSIILTEALLNNIWLYEKQMSFHVLRLQPGLAAHDELLAWLGIVMMQLATLRHETTAIQQRLRYEEIHFNKHLFREKQPLLSSRADDPYYTPMKEEVTDTLSFALHLLQVYFNSHKGLFLLNGVLALLLIAWIYHNHAFMTGKSAYAGEIRQQAPRVSQHPLAAACLMVFCFSPFLYRDMPFTLSSLFLLSLLISLTVLLWTSMEWKLRWRWVGLIFLFLRFDLMNLFIDVSWFERWLMIALNAGCIYLLITSYFIIAPRIQSHRWLLQAVIVLASLQQILAIVFNLVGYFNAARLFSINSVFTVITAMALKLSVDILVELTYMMYIRLQHHRLVNAAHSFTNTRRTARRILAGFAIVVWLVVFARTANIYDAIREHLFSGSPHRTII